MTSRLLNQGILIVVYVCAVSFPVKNVRNVEINFHAKSEILTKLA